MFVHTGDTYVDTHHNVVFRPGNRALDNAHTEL